MTSQPLALSGNRPSVAGRRGFTMTEMMVAIGLLTFLIVLVLGAVSKAQRSAAAARVKADLQAIAGALDAYASDFKGVYPMTMDVNGQPQRGRHILAKAIIGPGPATDMADPWMADGVDGPGFRATPMSKAQSPYLQADKFKVKKTSDVRTARLTNNPNDPTGTSMSNLPDNWELLDLWDNPIIYLPKRNATASGVFPAGTQPGMFNVNDADGYWDGQGAVNTGSLVAGIKQAATDGSFTGAFILLSAGRDGTFLQNMSKYKASDDLYNFDR